MAKRNEFTIMIDRPIESVFAFLANGENDKLFSERILEIAKTTEGEPGVGTIYHSVARDMGLKAKHDFEITEFDPPNRIRWREISKGPVIVREGGYDLKSVDGATELGFFGVIQGSGPGKLLEGAVARYIRRFLPEFSNKIKDVVEASV